MTTPAVHHGAFHFKHQRLWCESVDLKTLQEDLLQKARCPNSPVFVYSKQQLTDNINAYRDALSETGLKYSLGYSLKANSNVHLLRVVQSLGCFAVTVSGNEIQMALLAGFKPDSIIFNGNGKQRWEVQLAVKSGCLLNIDSGFDARNVVAVSDECGKKCRVLLRLNPALDARAHPYNCTALATSKFGIELSQLDDVVDQMAEAGNVALVGLHCHIGSTVSDVSVYEDVLHTLLLTALKLRNRGFTHLKFINIGGGLGIDYSRNDSKFPGPKDLVAAISRLFQNEGAEQFTLLLEPGRSIVGSAGVLLAEITGIKSNMAKNFIVTNAAMTEVIRPSLYAAHHHISLLDTSKCEKDKEEVFDIVGPVCGSGDFLGKVRSLPTPAHDSGIVIWDVGAYCFSMSSNYNLRGKVAEILVDDASWKMIRRPETFDDLVKTLDCSDISY